MIRRTRAENRILALTVTALALIAVLALATARPAPPGHPAPLRARLAACTWHYGYHLNGTGYGDYFRVWLYGSTCGSWPHWRARLYCISPRLAAQTIYGSWRAEPGSSSGNYSQAQCGTSWYPDIGYENVQYSNGSTQTFEDWHR